MDQKLNAIASGSAGAIVSAIAMLTLGFLANIGLYIGAASMMSQWHMFFDLSIFGIITGVIEAAIIGFIFVYLFALFYNKFLNS